jgi:hypothetical protein
VALPFLGIGIIVALAGVRWTKFGKNAMTALSAIVVIGFVLLLGGVAVPGELILLAMPMWVLSLVRSGKAKANK